jgi:cytidine deaminase
VESAAYGSTICAERTALLKAVSEGHRDDWQTMAVAGRGEDFCWPCGSCRQMLYEFAPELRILAVRGDGSFEEAKLSELLPRGFGAANLK